MSEIINLTPITSDMGPLSADGGESNLDSHGISFLGYSHYRFSDSTLETECKTDSVVHDFLRECLKKQNKQKQPGSERSKRAKAEKLSKNKI